MFDLALFQSRIDSFPEEYLNNFNYVWKRKVEIESNGNDSVLDEKHRDEIYRQRMPRLHTLRIDKEPSEYTIDQLEGKGKCFLQSLPSKPS